MSLTSCEEFGEGERLGGMGEKIKSQGQPWRTAAKIRSKSELLVEPTPNYWQVVSGSCHVLNKHDATMTIFNFS